MTTDINTLENIIRNRFITYSELYHDHSEYTSIRVSATGEGYHQLVQLFESQIDPNLCQIECLAIVANLPEPFLGVDIISTSDTELTIAYSWYTGIPETKPTVKGYKYEYPADSTPAQRKAIRRKARSQKKA